MKRWRLLVGLVLVMLTACGGGSGGGATALQASGAAANPAASFSAAAASPAAGGDAAGAFVDQEAVEQAQNEQGVARDRLVIRTANQSLVVERVDDAEARIRQIAGERGGYVLSSQSSGEAEARTASITLKVPSDRFDDTLAALAGLAQKVEGQQVEGQDVTDEFVDLEARLRNLQALEARLLQFLQQATNVEDSLRVSRELSTTQGEIEQTQGRITYLQESARFATITVALRGVPQVLAATDPEWSPTRTARESLQGMLAFGRAVITLAVVVGVWLPVWGPLTLIGAWAWRRARRLPATTL